MTLQTKNNKKAQTLALQNSATPKKTSFIDAVKLVGQMPKAFGKAMIGKDGFTESLEKPKTKGTSGNW